MREHERGGERAQGEHVVGAGIAELHERDGTGAHHRDRDFLVAQEVHQDPQDQRIGEGGEREVDAGQSERREPDEDGGHHRGQHADDEADPGREAEGDDEQHRHVGAHAEEGLMAERGLARVAADDVPGQSHRRPDEHELKHAVVVALAEQEREREAGQNDECDRDEVEEHPGFAGT